jgi:hypothetical protein
LSITKCLKLFSPLLPVRHSLSLQATAILQNPRGFPDFRQGRRAGKNFPDSTDALADASTAILHTVQ